MKLKALDPSRYESLKPYYEKYPMTVHDLLLTNLLLWREKHQIHTLEIRGFLYFTYKAEPDKTLYFSEPVGDWRDEENLKRSLDDLIAFSHQNNQPLKIRHASSQFLEFLVHFHYDFEADCLEDQFDYCYDTASLAHLAGNKFHKKKNHMNQFFKQYEDQFEFKAITNENANLALQVSKDWCIASGCEKVYDLCYEYKGIKEILDNWSFYESKGLEGLILFINGFPAAMTFGEAMSTEMFLIHIEKANTQFSNAYAAINHAMANKLVQRYKWINREQDMGIEGLRRAKRSYHPDFLLEKFNITL